jgi:ppGpp synthetase/RelA/SpoT-type nucleotidyltranferase
VIIPPSFAATYDREVAIAALVRELAANRIRVLCADRGWLFEDRLKSAESALAKAESGAVASLSTMLDLYAATIIVPTRTQVTEACDALLVRFEGEIKERVREVTAFPYDDTHMEARLGSNITPPVRARAVIERPFEIQVRTGTMWSWWRATHDGIYKGGRRDWRTERVAAQARAALELTDALLDDLAGAAALQQARRAPGDVRLEEAARLLDVWPAGRRPADVLRFSATALAYMDAASSTLRNIDEHMTAPPDQLASRPDITPGQAVMVASAQISALKHVTALREQGRRLFITPEMEALYPPLVEVGPDDRVAL